MHEEVLLSDMIGINVHLIPHYVSYAFLASLILITIAFMVNRSLRLVPTGLQNFIETIAEGILNLCQENIGRHWAKHFFPVIATIALYVAVCNFMGLIPGFYSPTSNINNNVALAVPIFLATHVYGLRVHGIGYFKHFLGPIRSLPALPLMILIFVIELIGHLVRPVTLSVRLFGNMVAKHIILLVLAGLTPWLIPTLILALGSLVSIIQAFVFTLLATLYLAGAVEEAH